jgi:hypothetical protein
VVEQKNKTLSIWKAFAKNQFLILVTVIFLLLTVLTMSMVFFMRVGVDQGYEYQYSQLFAPRGDNEITEILSLSCTCK